MTETVRQQEAEAGRVQVCEFCLHEWVGGRRRAFCPTCLPARADIPEGEYNHRYNMLYRAVGRFDPSPASRWRPPAPTKPERACTVCGDILAGQRKVYCSRRCAIRGQSDAARTRRASSNSNNYQPPAKAKRPTVVMPARKLRSGFVRAVAACPICHTPFERGLSWYCSDACRVEARRAVNMRKNIRRRGAVPVNAYTLRQVAEKSDHTCHLCSQRVDMALVWPDMMSPSVDHLVPLAKGGVDGLENVALAHLGCNCRRGAADLAA